MLEDVPLESCFSRMDDGGGGGQIVDFLHLQIVEQFNAMWEFPYNNDYDTNVIHFWNTVYECLKQYHSTLGSCAFVSPISDLSAMGHDGCIYVRTFF